MFKNYAEDLKNENIIFDENSINEIRTLIVILLLMKFK